MLNGVSVARRKRLKPDTREPNRATTSLRAAGAILFREGGLDNAEHQRNGRLIAP
jgi:hypothetical protein